MDQVSTCILCRPVKWVLPFVGNHLSIGIHPFRKWLVLLISFPRNPCRIGHMSWAEKCLTPCGPMYTTISRFVDHLGICGDYLVFDSPSFIAIFQCIFIATWYPVWCEMLVSDYVMMCNKLWVYFAHDWLCPPLWLFKVIISFWQRSLWVENIAYGQDAE